MISALSLILCPVLYKLDDIHNHAYKLDDVHEQANKLHNFHDVHNQAYNFDNIESRAETRIHSWKTKSRV